MMARTKAPAGLPRLLLIGLIASAIATGLLVAAAAWLVIDRTPSVAAGAENLSRLRPVWGAMAAGWLALSLVAWQLHRQRPGWTRNGMVTGAGIIAFALLTRGLVIVFHGPALSDDVYRYVFDGGNLAHGVNPYIVTPQERRSPATSTPLFSIPMAEPQQAEAERWAGESAVVRLVNNPELHTIYLPLSQLVFAAAGALAPESADDPLVLTQIYRALFVAIEGVLMFVLLIALRRHQRSAWWLVLYAWHPLPILEIAGEGHQDVIGVMLLVVALALYTSSPRRILGPIVSIALAVLVKPVALPVAALLLKGRSWRRWLAALAIGVVVTAAFSAPLLLAQDGEPLANLRATAERFSLKWAHFGSLYEPLLSTIESITPDWNNDPQEQLARKICTGVLGLVIIGVFLRGRDAWRDAGLIFLAMVLLTPTAHPWYLLWSLALIPIAPLRAVWVASLTLSWGYIVLADPVDWTVPSWVMWAAYVPIYGAVVLDVIDLWHRRAADRN